MPLPTSRSNGNVPSKGRFELPAISSDFGSLTAGTNIPPPPDSPIEHVSPPRTSAQQAIPTNGASLDVSKNRTPSSTTEDILGGLGPLNFHGVPNRASSARPDSSHTTGHNRTTSSQSISAASRISNGPTTQGSSPSRPNSVRRFLSRNSLSTQYRDSDPTSPTDNSSRPTSPSNLSNYSSASRPPNKKRASSWFSRFSSSNSVKEEEPFNSAGYSNGSNGVTQANARRQSTVPQLQAPVPQQRQIAPPVVKGPPPPQLPQLSRFKAKITGDTASFDAESMFANIK